MIMQFLKDCAFLALQLANVAALLGAAYALTFFFFAL